MIDFWNRINNRLLSISDLKNISEDIFSLEIKIQNLWEIIFNLDFPNKDL
jgi:hypothetical protein